MPLLQMEAITIQDNLHIKSLENYHTRLSWAGTGKNNRSRPSYFTKTVCLFD
jgi:hypothetical protein